MMKHTRHILIILFAFILSAQAQETTSGPDLQTVDNSFFDPTRKEEKVREDYHFGMEYRVEVGYAQANQRSTNITYPDMYLHGARMGATFTFLLPLHFSVQTGLIYHLSFGINDQHWHSQNAASTQIEYLRHRILQHNIVIPIRAYYTIPVWKQLNLFFYGGPQLQFTMGETDYMKKHLSDPTTAWLEANNIPTNQYDRVWSDELYHTNIQLGLGGGLEWDRYRIQAGYDFGLNNRVKNRLNMDRQMWEWSWYTSFSYRF